MLRSIAAVLGYNIQAEDGQLGYAKDFLFDDKNWAITHVVVDLGHAFDDRQVLVSPRALAEPNWEKLVLPVSLSKARLVDCPKLEPGQPVSWGREDMMEGYGLWQPYWGVAYGVPMPALWVPEATGETATAVAEPAAETRLRSFRDVCGYQLQASDGKVGHVDDFLMQTDGWAIRYLVIDTRHWLAGRKVLISPAWVTQVNWPQNRVFVDLTREEIKNSPKFDPTAPVNRQYEVRLYDYYGHPKYWE